MSTSLRLRADYVQKYDCVQNRSADLETSGFERSAFDLAILQRELAEVEVSGGTGALRDTPLTSGTTPTKTTVQKTFESAFIPDREFWRILECSLNCANKAELVAARSVLEWNESHYQEFVRGFLCGALSAAFPPGGSNWRIFSEKTIDEYADILCGEDWRRSSVQTIDGNFGNYRPDLVLVHALPPLPTSVFLIELKYVPLRYIRLPYAGHDRGYYQLTVPYQLSGAGLESSIHLHADQTYLQSVKLAFSDLDEDLNKFSLLGAPWSSSILHNAPKGNAPKETLDKIVDDALAQCDRYVDALNMRINSAQPRERTQAKTAQRPGPFKICRCAIVGAWRNSGIFL